jgi:hypothetical protein
VVANATGVPNTTSIRGGGAKLGDAHDLVRALPGQPRACPWHAPGLRRPTGACAADGIPVNPGVAAL